jgi:hypothetical protein
MRNGVPLCKKCHSAVHGDGYRIMDDGSRVDINAKIILTNGEDWVNYIETNKFSAALKTNVGYYRDIIKQLKELLNETTS